MTTYTFYFITVFEAIFIYSLAPEHFIRGGTFTMLPLPVPKEIGI